MSNAYSYERLGSRGDVPAVCGGLGAGVWGREVWNLRFLKVNRSNDSIELLTFQAILVTIVFA
jgi:hypothetical protein